VSSQSNVWIGRATALAIHEAQVREHGGLPGVRDLGLLEAALTRPINAQGYAEHSVDVPTLAALYAIAIIRNHPFVDGNKRVGFVLMETFLELNGYELTASDVDSVHTIFSVAGGDLDDAGFTTWVRERSRPRPDR